MANKPKNTSKPIEGDFKAPVDMSENNADPGKPSETQDGQFTAPPPGDAGNVGPVGGEVDKPQSEPKVEMQTTAPTKDLTDAKKKLNDPKDKKAVKQASPAARPSRVAGSHSIFGPRPCVGMPVVYIQPDKENAHNGHSDHPAVVTRVWSDTCVNLKVFFDGGPCEDRTSVNLMTNPERGNGGWAYPFIDSQVDSSK